MFDYTTNKYTSLTSTPNKYTSFTSTPNIYNRNFLAHRINVLICGNDEVNSLMPIPGLLPA